LVVDRRIEPALVERLVSQGAYFLAPDQIAKVEAGHHPVTQACRRRWWAKVRGSPSWGSNPAGRACSPGWRRGRKYPLCQGKALPDPRVLHSWLPGRRQSVQRPDALRRPGPYGGDLSRTRAMRSSADHQCRAHPRQLAPPTAPSAASAHIHRAHPGCGRETNITTTT
jgi:hypothetical protein